jgi:cobalt transporter subunit CbtB
MRDETDPSGMTGQRRHDMTKNAQATTTTMDRADVSLMPIAFAALAGLMLLFASGYAQASVLHDAAHDQRHAMAFPCH